MAEDDIRGLNIDFNYNNYGVFYEKLDEDKKGAGDDQQSNEEEERPSKEEKGTAGTQIGFQKLISDNNLLSKMWQRVDVDFDSFKDRYEEWLEEEVWTYFD